MEYRRQTDFHLEQTALTNQREDFLRFNITVIQKVYQFLERDRSGKLVFSDLPSWTVELSIPGVLLRSVPEIIKVFSQTELDVNDSRDFNPMKEERDPSEGPFDHQIDI